MLYNELGATIKFPLTNPLYTLTPLKRFIAFLYAVIKYNKRAYETFNLYETVVKF